MKNLFIRSGALVMAAFFLIAALTMVAPIQAHAADEYTISGIWVFNEVLDINPVANQSFYPIAFSVNNVMYYGVKFGSQSFQGFTDSDYSHVFHLYNAGSGGWIESEYKILDFGTTEQTVSTEFYTWLTANATFQAPPPDPGPLVEVMTDLQEQNQLTQVLMPLMTVIPIGLVCLVGYKGLRKALALLQGILQGA